MIVILPLSEQGESKGKNPRILQVAAYCHEWEDD